MAMTKEIYLEIYLELKRRIDKLKPMKGYAIYLHGSLARALRGIDSFRRDSDIDILIIPTLGKPTLTREECEKIERQLEESVYAHKLHVFSHPSILEWKDTILLKR